MTHPITPSPELVEQWTQMKAAEPEVTRHWNHIATRAARWGADQELEACISAILAHRGFENLELFVELLRAARRPKPPSLKEQALAELEQIPIAPESGVLVSSLDTIRRALERLPDTL